MPITAKELVSLHFSERMLQKPKKINTFQKMKTNIKERLSPKKREKK
jgi:hypothetical protein